MSYSEQIFYDDVLNHFKDNDAIFTMLKSIMLNSRIPPELSDIILGNIVFRENNNSHLKELKLVVQEFAKNIT